MSNDSDIALKENQSSEPIYMPHDSDEFVHFQVSGEKMTDYLRSGYDGVFRYCTYNFLLHTPDKTFICAIGANPKKVEKLKLEALKRYNVTPDQVTVGEEFPNPHVERYDFICTKDEAFLYEELDPKKLPEGTVSAAPNLTLSTSFKVLPPPSS